MKLIGVVVTINGVEFKEVTEDEQSIRDAIRQKQAAEETEKQADKETKKAALKIKTDASLADVIEVLSVMAEIESGRLE